jgi:uncharacterized protein (DUF885 family)
VSTTAAFTNIVDSYLDLRWNLDPVAATAAGVVERDYRLGTHGEDEVRQYVAALKSETAAMEEVEPDGLQGEIDRTALLDDARFTIHRLDEEQPHVRNPNFWVSHVLEGLYQLLVLRDRSREHRARAAAARIRAVPGYLEQARATLRDCPSVFVETGIDVIAQGGALIGEVRDQLEPPDDETFSQACDEAAAAVLEFGQHLRDELLNEANGDFAIGEHAFNFRLHYQHALRNTAPELWRYGLALVEQVEAELAQAAEAIEPGARWQDVADRLRAEHPSSGELVGAYAAQMERARCFVEERALVSLPEGALEVIATPAFLRPLIPFAAYHPPGAFSPDRTGWFYVTPPESGITPEVEQSILRDHCVYDLASTALHEGYPGHHLQFLSAQAQERTVRKVVDTPLTVEGWALYCEEMMAEEGFFSGPEELLFQKIALLFRAVRIVLDVGLHTRGMGFEEAVAQLMEKVQLDQTHAEAEVRRYCAEPAYQLCYAVGRRELRSLREAYRAAHGADYSLRGFHDAVLSYGGLPVSLMRWGMGLDE